MPVILSIMEVTDTVPKACGGKMLSIMSSHPTSGGSKLLTQTAALGSAFCLELQAGLMLNAWSSWLWDGDDSPASEHLSSLLSFLESSYRKAFILMLRTFTQSRIKPH